MLEFFGRSPVTRQSACASPLPRPPIKQLHLITKRCHYEASRELLKPLSNHHKNGAFSKRLPVEYHGIQTVWTDCLISTLGANMLHFLIYTLWVDQLDTNKSFALEWHTVNATILNAIRRVPLTDSMLKWWACDNDAISVHCLRMICFPFGRI